jgi:hypothetical protein
MVISGIFVSLFRFRRERLSRPSTISRIKQDVDARHKAGHDALNE